MAMSLVWNSIRTVPLFSKVSNENKEKFWTSGIAWNQEEGKCFSSTSAWEEDADLSFTSCSSSHLPDALCTGITQFILPGHGPIPQLLFVTRSLSIALLACDTHECQLCFSFPSVSVMPLLKLCWLRSNMFGFSLHCFQSWIVVVLNLVRLWTTVFPHISLDLQVGLRNVD